MLFRFVHMADVHLETPFQSRSARVRERLLDATRQAFERALRLAIERRADAILIAGDLFDSTRFSFRTERHLLSQLQLLGEAGVTVCYALGNHDPADADARFHRVAWPSHVHRFTSAEPRSVDILRGGRLVARVTGAGHETAAEARSLAAGFPTVSGDELPHVALLHAQIVGAEGADEHARYAPATLDDLRGKGYDYWALGHVHRRQRVFADPPVYYPGNLQGRHPAETGAKGVYWVELEKGRPPVIEFVPVAPVVWERWEHVCSPTDESLEGLVQSLAHAQPSRVESRLGGGEERIVRLDLRGESPLAVPLQVEENRVELEEIVRERFNLLDVEIIADGLRRPHTRRIDVTQSPFVDVVRGLIEQAERDPELLRQLAPRVLAGLQPGMDETEYLLSLLHSAEADWIERMLPEERR